MNTNLKKIDKVSLYRDNSNRKDLVEYMKDAIGSIINLDDKNVEFFEEESTGFVYMFVNGLQVMKAQSKKSLQ